MRSVKQEFRYICLNDSKLTSVKQIKVWS